MIDGKLEELIREEENYIVSLLLTKGKIKLIDPSGAYLFSNIKFSSKKDLISPEEFNKFVNLWPPGYRGSLYKIKNSMERFVLENNCSSNDIMNAARKWISEKDTPYHGNAENFLYNTDSEGNEKSRCKEFLTKAKIDFRNKAL